MTDLDPGAAKLLEALVDPSVDIQWAALSELRNYRGADAERVLLALFDKLETAAEPIQSALEKTIVSVLVEVMSRKRLMASESELAEWIRGLAARLKHMEQPRNDTALLQSCARIRAYVARLAGAGAASDGTRRLGGALATPPAPDGVAAATSAAPPAAESARPQMTACCPVELPFDRWTSLLAYLHLPDCRDTVAKDARERLAGEPPSRATSRLAEATVARGAAIDVIADFPGLDINPRSVRFVWWEEWHRAEFRVRATADRLPPEQSVNGRIAFYAESVLIGEVPASIFVTSDQSAGRDIPLDEQTASPYDSVFVSYSHRDEWIATRLSRALRTLGMELLRDVETLRSGEVWSERLLELIDDADIFQLYWSENARQSVYVEQEWRRALATGRQDFIRPVYWERPLPRTPADLSHVHFAFYSP